MLEALSLSSAPRLPWPPASGLRRKLLPPLTHSVRGVMVDEQRDANKWWLSEPVSGFPGKLVGNRGTSGKTYGLKCVGRAIFGVQNI